jgi:histone-lysine N-methyltransferase ASH1L
MDEGLMIQCERCLVWQHSDCVKADSSVEHYLCEQCVPRQVNRDILMNPQPDYATPGQIYYISLMREDLQLRQGMTYKLFIFILLIAKKCIQSYSKYRYIT